MLFQSPCSKSPVSTSYVLGSPAISESCDVEGNLKFSLMEWLCLRILPCSFSPLSPSMFSVEDDCLWHQWHWHTTLLETNHFFLFQWYKNPDYRFFDNYKSYRKLHPDQPFYILRPQMPWELWDIIQEISPEEIQPNPPSSGMLGESMSGKDLSCLFIEKISCLLWCRSFTKQLLGFCWICTLCQFPAKLQRLIR